MFLKVIVVAVFVFAVPFFVSAQEAVASTPPAFLKDIKTKEDVAKLTPAEQKQFEDFMRQRIAQTQVAPPTLPTPLTPPTNTTPSQNQNSSIPVQIQAPTPFLSMFTVKVLVAAIPLLIVIVLVFYRIWRKKRDSITQRSKEINEINQSRVV